MSDDLAVATSVGSEMEADLVCARLREAGIHALSQRSIGGPEWGTSGARYVYVKQQDLERARALLSSEAESVSDEELNRLSDDAGSAGDA